MTTEPSSPPIERFDTDNAMPHEQFDAWAAGVPFFDFSPGDNTRTAFDMRCQHAAFGPFVLENRVWRHPSATAAFGARRTSRHVRADQHDYICFNLQVSGTTALRTRSASHVKHPGDLYVVDYGRPFESVVSSGHEIALAVPRTLLRPDPERQHGHSLTEGAVALLKDHLLSLREHLPTVPMAAIPYLVDATTQLLMASLHAMPDRLPETNGVTEALLARRVRRYIDAHLLAADLAPDRICKDVGLSRAKLYQLFANTGGVMREIRGRRLDLAHRTLAQTPDRHDKMRAIAQRFGFEDEKYFSRVYKARYGYAPSETFDRMHNTGRPDNE
ncbi:helix-turn-helix domain-containing protein [Burkholderia stagnalis]